MEMISRWKKFLEEVRITRELTPEEAFNEFITTLKECQKAFEDKFQFANSYSYVAIERRANYDPDDDFKLINEFMSKRGWTLDSVALLAQEYGRENFNAVIDNINPSSCGPIDYYLWKVTEGTFPLQGYEWDDFISNPGEVSDNEFLIRFGYGWHKTKYGRLCIEQNLGSVDRFIELVLSQIPDYILNLFFNYRGFRIFKNIYGTGYRDFIKDFKEIFLFFDGSYWVHLDELYYLCKHIFILDMSIDEFYNTIVLAIDNLNKDGDFKIKVTRRENEFRISI